MRGVVVNRVDELLAELHGVGDAGGNLRVTVESALAANPLVTSDEIRDMWREATEEHAAEVAHDAIDPDAQCPEHGCARHRCDAEHEGVVVIVLRATFTNGDRDSRVEASTIGEARFLMQTEMFRRFGGDTEIEYFEDRGLVWSCEEDSIGDDGTRAVASIYEIEVQS